MFNMTFEDDFEYLSEKVSQALNIFSETVVANNQMVTMYGNEDFISLTITPYKDRSDWGSLRLRTRDMAAQWENVPSGFSQINESRGLFADMKRAAHASLKRNSIWYIDNQIKDAVGDRVVFTELTTNKGYLYKVEFTNGYVTYLTITKDEREYHQPHDTAMLYALAQKNKEPISAMMTADACMVLLINVAMQVDKRAAEFVTIAERCGGKSVINNIYRTSDESVDEAKAVFSNGYALKFQIKNDELIVDVLGRHDQVTYLLDSKIFTNINDVYDVVKEVSQLPKYQPVEN